MKAQSVFREKRILENPKTGKVAIVELKIWKVPKSKAYPEGRKFSLFLVSEGKVLFGMNNHKPKGPHLHFGEQERPYGYQGDEQLLEDFWELARKAGYQP
ncbi:MAG: hypothetical protein EA369_00680 [Bradymonadales bacterium]|nr:MAG: hypothetical protein EA369_00680 [Bradymonadales bacterium]